MSLLGIVVLAVALSAPALHGLVTGAVDADQVGLRVLMALVVAALVARVTGLFTRALAAPPRAQEGPESTPRRRRTDV